MWEELERLELSKRFRWSVIDRWNDHPTFIRAVARRVEIGLQQIPAERRERAVIVFTAHSLPMKVVAKADQYPQEVGHTVQLVMKQLQENFSAANPGKKLNNPYVLSWQSKVGYLPWLVPSTGALFEGKVPLRRLDLEGARVAWSRGPRGVRAHVFFFFLFFFSFSSYKCACARSWSRVHGEMPRVCKRRHCVLH